MSSSRFHLHSDRLAILIHKVQLLQVSVMRRFVSLSLVKWELHVRACAAFIKNSHQVIDDVHYCYSSYIFDLALSFQLFREHQVAK